MDPDKREFYLSGIGRYERLENIGENHPNERGNNNLTVLCERKESLCQRSVGEMGVIGKLK